MAWETHYTHAVKFDQLRDEQLLSGQDTFGTFPQIASEIGVYFGLCPEIVSY